MIFAAGTRSPDAYAFMRWANGTKKFHKGYALPESDFLLYDERIDREKPAFPDAMPGAKLWGREGAGFVQFRSKGWAQDATIVEFKCGDHVWSHTHNANQNSFTIFHKGRLAIQTGNYSDNAYFGNHTRYYYARTVSCNGMLIIDPAEFSCSERMGEVKGEDAEGCYPEHGGQRLIRGSCNTFTFPEYLARKTADPSELRGGKAQQHWETGDITAFDHAPDYAWSYVCGDATQAYNNPKRTYGLTTGRKNRPKIDLFTRSMVFLDGKDLLVFDRVNALDPSFRKAWLLHSQAKPDVSGKLIKAEVPDHIEDFDGETTIVTWGDSRLPPPDSKDSQKGRLWVRTYLPEEHVIRRIGGPGYEFWAGGTNHPPGKRGADFVDTPDDGNWRVEVSPTKPAAFDAFLHGIHIGDTGETNAPTGAVVTDTGGKMKGLSIGNWVVMFGLKGSVDGDVSYQARAGATRHLVLDVARGGRYALTGAGGEKTLTAGPEGVLDFTAPAGASVTLRPMK
jgi:heparin/heparan-sulfate lyase